MSTDQPTMADMEAARAIIENAIHPAVRGLPGVYKCTHELTGNGRPITGRPVLRRLSQSSALLPSWRHHVYFKTGADTAGTYCKCGVSEHNAIHVPCWRDNALDVALGGGGTALGELK
jgi:hypothetical protein